MIDRDLIVAKAAKMKKHLRRVEARRGSSLEAFIKDLDRQDIVLFNLKMAIQFRKLFHQPYTFLALCHKSYNLYIQRT